MRTARQIKQVKGMGWGRAMWRVREVFSEERACEEERWAVERWGECRHLDWHRRLPELGLRLACPGKASETAA